MLHAIENVHITDDTNIYLMHRFGNQSNPCFQVIEIIYRLLHCLFNTSFSPNCKNFRKIIVFFKDNKQIYSLLLWPYAGLHLNIILQFSIQLNPRNLL